MKQFIKNIGKTFLFTVSCGLLSAGIYAQTQNTGNNIWSFPPNYYDQLTQFDPLPQVSNPNIGDDYNGELS